MNELNPTQTLNTSYFDKKNLCRFLRKSMKKFKDDTCKNNLCNTV